MEMTDELITEAIENKADMIITHHPLIFDPIKSIHCCTPQGRFIKRLIQNEIVLYSSHTPFDISKGGNTDHLMKLMGVTKVKVVPGTEEFLKAGVLAKETTLADFAYMLAEKLDLPGLKFTGDPEKKIKTVSAKSQLMRDSFASTPLTSRLMEPDWISAVTVKTVSFSSTKSAIPAESGSAFFASALNVFSSDIVINVDTFALPHAVTARIIARANNIANAFFINSASFSVSIVHQMNYTLY
jgi:hypothetical protein